MWCFWGQRSACFLADLLGVSRPRLTCLWGPNRCGGSTSQWDEIPSMDPFLSSLAPPPLHNQPATSPESGALGCYMTEMLLRVEAPLAEWAGERPSVSGRKLN